MVVIGVMLGAGCKAWPNAPPADAGMAEDRIAAFDVGKTDVMVANDGAKDVVAPPDTAPTTDAPAGDDVTVPTDVPPADTGGVSMPVILGDFVGGAAQDSAGGITLNGQFNWHVVVSSTADGIILDGVLR
jgi:hypothetical protein